jgi:hypothetical protein
MFDLNTIKSRNEAAAERQLRAAGKLAPTGPLGPLATGHCARCERCRPVAGESGSKLCGTHRGWSE